MVLFEKSIGFKIILSILTVLAFSLGSIPGYSFSPIRTSDLKADPPKSLIIYAHPDSGSFNHAIKKTILAELQAVGHQVKIRDLYSLGFDPVLSRSELENYDFPHRGISDDIKAEQEAIQWADHLIFIYPTWWWSMPAIMKGYLDRVFLPGFAFSADENGINGLLDDKKAWIIQTTGSDGSYIAESGLDDVARKVLDLGFFSFCGIEVIGHHFLPAVQTISEAERKEMLERLKVFIKERF